MAMLTPNTRSSKAQSQVLSSKQMEKPCLNRKKKPLTVRNTGAGNTQASNLAKITV
jgi:hypothetical protein